MNNHDILNEKVVTQEDNSITLEVLIPGSSDFYDGHFPQYKLLPAVAQFEIVTRFAKKYFGTQRYVPTIKRIKFSAPIRPETVITVEMNYNKEKQLVAFTIKDSEKTYSSGTFNVLPE